MNIVDISNIEIKPYSGPPIEDKIKGFALLPTGWHFGEGIPPSTQRISDSVSIANEGMFYDFEVDAFPGIGGEVLVALYCKNEYIEFTLADTVTFVHEKNNEEVGYRENLSVFESLQLIRGCKESCRLSELSTSSTTTQEDKSLRVWHSETSRGESPLFLGSAYSLWGTPFAVT